MKRVRSLDAAIIAAQGYIGKVAPLTLEDVLALTLEHSEAVAGRLKGDHKAKDAAYTLVLLIEKERDELTELVSFLKDRAKKFLVDMQSLGADLIALVVENDSQEKFLAAMDAELEGHLVTVSTK